MTRPSIIKCGSKKDLWTKHEERVLEIFKLALIMLRNEASLPRKEDDLNRTLCRLIRCANRQLHDQQRGLDYPLFYEARNQPSADDITRSEREDKRPDFQWGMCDHNEPDPDRMDKHYIIESKRIGLPSSSTWVLNKNYVVNGIHRFIHPAWGYGHSTRSGAMIGYIQDMEPEDILKEINATTAQVSLPVIVLSSGSWQVDVSSLQHLLPRADIPPTPFELRHLWVDLRPCSQDKI